MSLYFLSSRQPTILFRYVWNFAWVLFMLWRLSCGLDIIVRLIDFFLKSPVLTKHKRRRCLSSTVYFFIDPHCLFISYFSCHPLTFKINIFKNYFRNTIRVSSSLDPGSKVFVKVISKIAKSPLAKKELTLKAPHIICYRRQFQILSLFLK